MTKIKRGFSRSLLCSHLSKGIVNIVGYIKSHYGNGKLRNNEDQQFLIEFTNRIDELSEFVISHTKRPEKQSARIEKAIDRMLKKLLPSKVYANIDDIRDGVVYSTKWDDAEEGYEDENFESDFDEMIGDDEDKDLFEDEDEEDEDEQ